MCDLEPPTSNLKLLPMIANKMLSNIAGWLVFAIAFIVYYLSAERTGSLWDCGEFILGAYKLQVVHPPGAPLFLVVGRLFAWVADLFSDNPENISFAVNMLSGMCTAFAAAFISWITITLSKLALVGRDEEMSQTEAIATAAGGVVAGLSMAFCISIWFSAVEGEVYAMSTFFTALTLWAVVKWYALPNHPQHDRWLLFAVYAAGLSMGVHLLSILTFPALALFYYFKKYRNHTFLGMAAAAGAGVLAVVLIQKVIIVGIPAMWGAFDLLMVNSFGLPFNSGIIPTILVISAALFFGLRYAHNKQNAALQYIMVGMALVIISFSTIGVVILRANAATPINMNDPSDAMRLIPYLNREQYGERPLLRGPNFEGQPTDTKIVDRYGRVGDHYEYTDQKISYDYAAKDEMLFPRMGDYSSNRPQLYKIWMNSWRSASNQVDPNKPLPPGEFSQSDNLNFLFSYQIGWMYWRYFMWNFAGRQNGDQGYFPWDKSSGHWFSGISFLENNRLYDQSQLPDTIKTDPARNRYFLLPFIFGVIGLLFHFQRRRNDALGLLAMFIITGIGIIIYSNQPPNEPRERDYVLAGSFFTFCIWIGMAVPAIFDLLRKQAKLSGVVAAGLASIVVLSAPLLMGTQNYDDMDRSKHKASRDYASNFLESCAPNAIIFTYGDNDTYPLWYAQEVEGIRTDVRVVNLSLIAVDWYVDLLRRKVNESDAIKMTVPIEAYRGKKRNQVFYVDHDQNAPDPDISVYDFLKYVGEEHPVSSQGGRSYESHYYTKSAFIPVDKNKLLADGIITAQDTANVSDRIPLDLNKDYLLKDDLAVLDVIVSNLWERPVYFAVTCQQGKLLGLQDFMSLEGLSLRITPVRGKSDPSYGIIGNGRVNSEAVYKNVMEKFRWGNFDKYDLFVDRSYTPSVQSIQLSIRRSAMDMVQKGDTTRAMQLVDKYFASFPHMNFPYDYRTMYMLDVYLQAKNYTKAKPHLQILAKQAEQYLRFYTSMDASVLESSFKDDYSLMYRVMEDLTRIARENNDTAFQQEVEAKFKPFQVTPTENMIPPPQ